MEKPIAADKTYQNLIFGAFPSDVRDRIIPFVEPIELSLGVTVCEAGGALTHAYFPQGCVLSLLTVLENGSEIECANIGREGAFGLFGAMYSRTSYIRSSVQLEGKMLRCAIEPLRVEVLKSEYLRELIISYSEILLSQIVQTVACNSLHPVEKRMSRWLLLMHDRAEGETLTYTLEVFARIMDVKQPLAIHAAKALQKKGLIRYRRGMMQVVDRTGLVAESCECYAIVKKRFDAFLEQH